MQSTVDKLQNGVRIVRTPAPWSRIIHCGWIVNAGSRDEHENENGIAHFIEHMIFKGTSKRNNYQVLNYLESVGGELNAYTSREKTCIYATVGREYLDRAIELLTDITFNSKFPEKEITKEKQVVAEEIDMYRDNPEEAIFEDFDHVVFPGDPLGHPILGTKQCISGFDRASLQDFVGRNYGNNRMVFSVSGGFDEKILRRAIQKHIEVLPAHESSRNIQRPARHSPTHLSNRIILQQLHHITGGRAYPRQKGHFIPFYLLNNYLGGPAMNTRLNLNIREKYGLSYNIYSFYTPYEDSGIWGVYFACDPGNFKQIQQLVKKELKTFRDQKPGTLMLSRIKKQFLGQLVISFENLLTQMLSNGKDELDFERQIRFEEIRKKVEAVTASDILEAANEIFDPDEMSSLTYEPVANKLQD